MTTELVAQLRLVRPKAKYEFAKDHFLMIGKVMREAADELERLERERAEWAGIAAQRNRTNALLADDRDTERTKRLQAQHERDCAVEDVARLKALLGAVLEDGWRDQDIPLVMKRRGVAPMDVRWTHYSPPDVPARPCGDGCKGCAYCLRQSDVPPEQPTRPR